VATLVEAAESSSTLVLGNQGHSRLAELLLNSVSQETARKARVPVVVARPEPSRRTYGVLVGVDGSRPSLRALDFACRHAALTDDHVSVMTGWRSGAAPVGAHGTGVLLSTRVHHEQDMLERVVAEARIAHPSLTIEPHLVHRDPGRALTDASASAALVVVGCQGLTALEEVVLGSVSQQVLRRARCPVAVVH
jgi:nucleotide-binding universal stress UspA family protein